AIFASTFKSFEVIVVDDCSTDDSAEMGRKKGARVLSTTRNSGPAAARNLAAQTAVGEILLFVDADVVIKSDTLDRVAARFKNQPEISALFGSYDDEPAEQNFLSQYKNLQHHFVHQYSNTKASTFWAGLGAVRRDVFIEVGGFDCKKFQVPSVEDIEFGLRLTNAGHKILLDRDIQGKHLKKWRVVSHLRTEIFSRALPWSKLITQNNGIINDMNLRTSDRVSAGIVALFLVTFPLVFWKSSLLLLTFALMLAIIFLNREIFKFFAKKKGIVFAIMILPWQFLYFFYSGTAFVVSWFWYTLPLRLGIRPPGRK
ncbi:MAG: glycosyltransferase, partial [Pyrinomonadaceae bacterium]